MTVTRQHYGTIAGKPVDLFEITNRPATGCDSSPTARGSPNSMCQTGPAALDVVLGLDSLEEYITSWACMGATCGRYANRIGHGELIIDGKRHQLPINWREHHLHGGPNGFDRQIWNAAATKWQRSSFSLPSPDGDEGYPGEVEARVIYRLEDDGLAIVMEAGTTQPTAINLVHHSYWNLAGHSRERPAIISCRSRRALHPVRRRPAADGEIAKVASTPFDLRKPRLLSKCFDALARQGQTDGYDNNWCLDGGRGVAPGGETRAPVLGTQHDRLLDRARPAGIHLRQLRSRNARQKRQQLRAGVRRGARNPGLSGQPHQPEFPTALLAPGETYRHEMRFAFSR